MPIVFTSVAFLFNPIFSKEPGGLATRQTKREFCLSVRNLHTKPGKTRWNNKEKRFCRGVQTSHMRVIRTLLRFRNAECGMRNWGFGNAECGMRNWKTVVLEMFFNSEIRNPKSEIRLPWDCRLSIVDWWLEKFFQSTIINHQSKRASSIVCRHNSKIASIPTN